MAVQWDPALALGHADIDAQHRELFRRFRALVDAMESGSGSEVGLLLEFLREYVVQHFSAEEQLMRDSAYPGATVHKAAHDRFVRDYNDLQRLYDANGATAGVVVKTQTWILGWLESHIGGVDRALAWHLRERARAAVPPSPRRVTGTA